MFATLGTNSEILVMDEFTRLELLSNSPAVPTQLAPLKD